METLNKTIESILAGNMDAYARIVEMHQEMLIDFVSFRLPDPDLVREVVHKTFISAYNQLDQYDMSRDFGVWLRVICRYQTLTEIKRYVRERERKNEFKEQIRDYLLDSALGQEMEDSEYLAREALAKCLKTLTGHAGKLVGLRYRKGKSSKEIADQLGRTTTWVTTTLHRARQSLRKCIEEKLEAGLSG